MGGKRLSRKQRRRCTFQGEGGERERIKKRSIGPRDFGRDGRDPGVNTCVDYVPPCITYRTIGSAPAQIYFRKGKNKKD